MKLSANLLEIHTKLYKSTMGFIRSLHENVRTGTRLFSYSVYKGEHIKQIKFRILISEIVLPCFLLIFFAFVFALIP